MKIVLLFLKWEYCLGSGCSAEPRVEESIRSKYNKGRCKLMKTEDRSHEHEHPVPRDITVTAVPKKIELDGFDSFMFGFSPKILYD